jgi:hypothetical protein
MGGSAPPSPVIPAKSELFNEPVVRFHHFSILYNQFSDWVFLAIPKNTNFIA